MSSTPNPTIVKVTTPATIDVSDLTSGAVNGSGVFDQLMRGVNAQLDKQFKADRITGSEYAAIYTEAIKQVLATSSSVLFEKAKQAYELTLLDLQVDAAREDLKIAKINQEKVRKEVAQLDREIVRTDVQIDILSYELRNKLPVEVSNMVKQGQATDIQINQETYRLIHLLPLEKTSMQNTVALGVIQRGQEKFRLDELLPLEKKQATEQINSIVKDTAIKNYQFVNLLPNELARGVQQLEVIERTTVLQENQSSAQVADTQASIEIKEFQLNEMMPVEVVNLTKQGLILDGQKANSDSQLLTLTLQREVMEVEKDTAIYRLSTVMPVELANIGKQGDLFDQELLSKPVERSLLEAEGLIKDKQLDVMDSEIAGQVSQNALYDQKTLSERANVDSSVIGTDSLFDKQRELLIEQHETFVKDAKQKVAKLMIDTWGIRFTEDAGAAPVGLSGLHDTNVKLAVEELLRSIDVVPNTYVPPPTTP